ncbi:MAG: hypothetical protein DCC71_14655 [Proteobacteria bacterium]|nr:MAG: hypothetical protein DCC71_14655 [Pseudomonadota bacterium]
MSARAGRALVVGVGNPLRRDDAAGPLAAQRLAAEGIETRALHQPLPELAAELAHVAVVVFVDADRSVAPGAVHVRRIDARPDAAWSHALSIEAVLALTRALAGRAPAAFAVTIGAADLGVGEGLSAPVAAAFETLLARVRERLDAPLEAEEDPAVASEVSGDA